MKRNTYLAFVLVLVMLLALFPLFGKEATSRRPDDKSVYISFSFDEEVLEFLQSLGESKDLELLDKLEAEVFKNVEPFTTFDSTRLLDVLSEKSALELKTHYAQFDEFDEILPKFKVAIHPYIDKTPSELGLVKHSN